jgi:hypothetical protein
MRKGSGLHRSMIGVFIIVPLLIAFQSACTGHPQEITATPSSIQVTPMESSRTPTITSTIGPGLTPVPLEQSGPKFPRLGMWWPNGWHQPLEDIARYDWVILGDYQKQFIDPLRAINPNVLLLTSTDALEIHYYPGEPDKNQDILKVPYQWFLTQVGSTLGADIDSVQTTIPVKALTMKNGDKSLDLFRAGDCVLIENESVYVKSIDFEHKTLLVQRGFVRPASSHKAGTRLAAHASTWPDTWMLNVSTLSPQAVVDPSIGPEIWPEYNARRGALLLADPRWSGILVDRSETGQSRYVDGELIRSIDPDQSNRLPADYASFDSTWNDGLRLYLGKLRQAIGPDRIIFLNWGIDDFQAVNGDNFEGFPDEEGKLGSNSWHDVVFGPYLRGSYFDWVTQSPQPNITMIETYEDNTVLSGFTNHCGEASFTPNYRKMRFGLTTALLNDGYFSYEMNTNGHGSLCLMWFDEYDNAGAGRGYLGYPLGAAYMLGKDRISSVGGGLEVWQRDYQNGVVLVNASQNAVTVTLEGAFRKINGTQDPSTNDGSLITQVSLQPNDGIILLNP